jgi:hypothetical protein
LINAARDLEKTNESPPGVQNPALYYKHGDQLLLEGNDSWTAHYAAKMKADYDALISILLEQPA